MSNDIFLDAPGPSVRPEPIMKSPVIQGDTFKIVVKLDDLLGEAYAEITEPSTGEVIIVPSKFIRAMSSIGQPFSLLHREKINMQRNAHHPLDLFGDLVNAGESSDRIKVIVSGTNINEIGIPVLTWQSEAPAHIVKKKENNIIVNPISGWRLTLTGFPDEVLGFAAWNDLESISKLCVYMKNKKNLSAHLGLSNLEEGRKLTAGLALQEYVKANNVPSMTLRGIRKKLIDAGYDNNKKGQVAPLIVEVDGKKVIIAIGVSKDITYYSIGDSNEAQRRITSILTSGTNGIRSVDLTQLLVENKLTYRRHYSIPVWFTSIPESDWTRMSPGIPVVAKIDASRSWF